MNEERHCQHCGDPFTPGRWWQKYCEAACKDAHRRQNEMLGGKYMGLLRDVFQTHALLGVAVGEAIGHHGRLGRTADGAARGIEPGPQGAETLSRLGQALRQAETLHGRLGQLLGSLKAPERPGSEVVGGEAGRDHVRDDVPPGRSADGSAECAR